MAFTRQTRLTTTVLAGLATLSLLASATGCSSDEKSKDPQIADAAPRTGAAIPKPTATTSPSIPPTPAITKTEAGKTAQEYFDLSKTAKSSHDTPGLDEIESGVLLDISKARQGRIQEYGDKIQLSEEMAVTTGPSVAMPEAAPMGDDRWLLSVSTQKLGSQSRYALGVQRQIQGLGPWKMSFLSFTEKDRKVPPVTTISTLDGSHNLASSNIDHGEQLCSNFASELEGNKSKTKWDTEASATIQIDQNNKKDFIALTKGGKLAASATPKPESSPPAWKTIDGGRLVMCTIEFNSELSAGPSGSFTINKSNSFENLTGRTTKWKSIEFTNIGMYAFKIPQNPDSNVELIARSGRPLNTTGNPA